MILLVAPSLERAIRGSLGLDLRLAVAAQPLPAARLSIRERSRAAQLATPARRIEWLTGRAALKHLLAELGRNADTADITFPDARCSLTHSSGTAVAAGIQRAGPRGVGVDLELRPGMDPRAARYFLTPTERSCVGRAGIRQEAELLRLWTVKEALYKADPENRGRVLGDYRLSEPARTCGHAAVGCGGRFRYASLAVPRGFLAVAVCLRGEPSCSMRIRSGC